MPLRLDPVGVQGAAGALRRGREALTDIQGQLDALLAVLRMPQTPIDPAMPERLAGAARQAGRALSALSDLRI